jgi:hypothetical protein
MAKERLGLLQGIRVVPVTSEAADLARLLVASGLVPEIASPDAVHIALASVHQIDFLVTWNFKHIANPHIRERMRTKINDSGYQPLFPRISGLRDFQSLADLPCQEIGDFGMTRDGFAASSRRIPIDRVGSALSFERATV